MANATSRFTDRVENYVKYRPGYPEGVIDFLRERFKWSPGLFVADVGSGTGISSELFLRHGNRVAGVEPNAAMRERSLGLLKAYPGFTAMDGSAEATGLASGTADIIVAGQAFHWFDRELARKEFFRILKPGGIVVLMWNERLVDTAFARAYDQLIVDHGIDYVKVDHRNIDDDAIATFFAPGAFQLKVLENNQVFDFNGLKGRLTSSSYVPNEDDARYPAMIAALASLFERYATDETVTIRYATKVYAGRLTP